MSNQYNSALVTDMARLGEPSCTEDNNRLYPLVAKGDADARRQMIEGNMPLVVAKVNAYLVEFPHLGYLRDDLTSAGFVGLVEATSNMQRRKVKNPTSYLSIAINRGLSQLLENEAPIRVPKESQRRAKAKGKEIEVPIVTNKMPDHCRLPIAPQVEEVEARELLRSCCKDCVERRILRLRELGHTYEQIATGEFCPRCDALLAAGDGPDRRCNTCEWSGSQTDARVPRSKSEIGRIVKRIRADYYERRGLRRRQKRNSKKRKSKKHA